MNIYNKINKYLLERYPTLWNTQFVWMIAIGILTHILFFIIGYNKLSIELLKNEYINDPFFSIGTMSLFSIICLLSFLFFCFRYFTHNPFKNFYPLQGNYFWKIFTQLFIIIFLFTTVFISFEKGYQVKLKKILPQDQFIREVNKVNLATPFLFNEIEKYYITERAYPSPFPLDELSDFSLGYDTLTDTEITHGIKHTEPFITINNAEFQFGKIGSKMIDSCSSIDVIEKYIDVSKVYGLSMYSIFNYNAPIIKSTCDTFYFSDNYLPKIHEWVNTQNQAAIAQSIKDVKNICEKYAIKNNLEAEDISQKVLAQDLNSKQLISTTYTESLNNEAVEIASAEAVAANREVEEHEQSRFKHPLASMRPNYFIDLHKFIQMNNNVETIHKKLAYNYYTNSIIWAFIIFSWVFSLLLIVFKYLSIKNIFVGLIVASIIGILIALLIYFIELSIDYEHIDYRDNITLIASLIICISLIIAGTKSIINSRIKKSLANAFFISTSLSLLAILPLLLLGINFLFETKVYEKCSDYTRSVYPVNIQAWHIFPLSLISLHFIFMLLKRMHAKAE